MNGVLGVWLRKEWREQRHIVLAVALLAPLAVLAGGLWLPRERIDVDKWMATSGMACCLFVLIAVGSDTIPGEVRGRGLALLRRLPTGLGPPLAAKAGLLVVSMLGIAVWGLLCGLLGRALLGDQPLSVADLWPTEIVRPCLAVLGIAAWLLAVSSWLPRPGLAFMVTLVLVVGAAVLGCQPFSRKPVPVVFQSVPWWMLSSWLAVAAVLGAAVAWLSFLRGYAHGGGPRRAAASGVPVLVAALSPLAFGEVRDLFAWRWLDPASPHFRIHSAFLSADGRRAFVNARDRRFDWHRCTAMRVELDTGEWHRMSGRWYETPALVNGGPAAGHTGQHRVVGVLGVDVGGQARRYSWLDSASLDVLGEGADPRTASAGLADRMRASLRATTPHRTPDGRRIWFFERGLERETESGGYEAVPIPDGLVPAWSCGFGFYVTAPHATWHGWLDPSRQRALEVAGRPAYVFVRPGAWVVGYHAPYKNQSGARPGSSWHLLDPATGELRPAMGLGRRDRVVECLDARIVLGYSYDSGVFAVDPEMGERREVRCDFDAGPLDPGSLTWVAVVGRTPLGARILSLGDPRRRFLARLDERERRLTFCRVPDVELVGALGEDTAIVRTDRALWRVRFGGETSQQLFPRP